MRKWTRRQARALARKSWESREPGQQGGRPRKPAPCARCGTECASVTEARAHCMGAR